MWIIILKLIKNPKNIIIIALVAIFGIVTLPLYIKYSIQEVTINKLKNKIEIKETENLALKEQINIVKQNLSALQKHNENLNKITRATNDIQRKINNINFKPNIVVNSPFHGTDENPNLTGGGTNETIDSIAITNLIIKRFNDRM